MGIDAIISEEKQKKEDGQKILQVESEARNLIYSFRPSKNN
jgi:hypothetical protein